MNVVVSRTHLAAFRQRVELGKSRLSLLQWLKPTPSHTVECIPTTLTDSQMEDETSVVRQERKKETIARVRDYRNPLLASNYEGHHQSIQSSFTHPSKHLTKLQLDAISKFSKL